mmetsp:Transcript_62151/g.170766  ORF Transcript_62151/g.170766 Transcript_62151/m.170766 type:complete len:589 (+) Transcript_62151:77-1843(+)
MACSAGMLGYFTGVELTHGPERTETPRYHSHSEMNSKCMRETQHLSSLLRPSLCGEVLPSWQIVDAPLGRRVAEDLRALLPVGRANLLPRLAELGLRCGRAVGRLKGAQLILDALLVQALLLHGRLGLQRGLELGQLRREARLPPCRGVAHLVHLLRLHDHLLEARDAAPRDHVEHVQGAPAKPPLLGLGLLVRLGLRLGLLGLRLRPPPPPPPPLPPARARHHREPRLRARPHAAQQRLGPAARAVAALVRLAGVADQAAHQGGQAPREARAGRGCDALPPPHAAGRAGGGRAGRAQGGRRRGDAEPLRAQLHGAEASRQPRRAGALLPRAREGGQDHARDGGRGRRPALRAQAQEGRGRDQTRRVVRAAAALPRRGGRRGGAAAHRRPGRAGRAAAAGARARRADGPAAPSQAQGARLIGAAAVDARAHARLRQGGRALVCCVAAVHAARHAARRQQLDRDRHLLHFRGARRRRPRHGWAAYHDVRAEWRAHLARTHGALAAVARAGREAHALPHRRHVEHRQVHARRFPRGRVRVALGDGRPGDGRPTRGDDPREAAQLPAAADACARDRRPLRHGDQLSGTEIS